MAVQFYFPKFVSYIKNTTYKTAELWPDFLLHPVYKIFHEALNHIQNTSEREYYGTNFYSPSFGGVRDKLTYIVDLV